ncbi:hypothetical protein [Alteromonas macleodii]|jgi:hypothetical protein|uniref:hypothetical protein n=1 Tax=Alteromonas macleodii TaxID=28108 RepID=UPI000B66722E|nr:hypothetical protein [Alteromonadaceae bacterium A_SAG1]OUU96757.1 MAG: hypothetical protein CBC39_10375 [Cellvibrionales bacterium TMED79]|tara:strand:- start:189 stop:395 length:207 start_codon:yes stop_codon:yes gene_type:complete
MSRDKNLVNFSEEYELNRHLKKVGKRQTIENRETLKGIGDKVKKELNKKRLRHDELEDGIAKNLNHLD